MAGGRSESMRQQQAKLSAQLRSEGKTWVETAEVFQSRFRVNPRVALRMVRGWSQAQAAEVWNRLWPDESKTFKSFSCWEIWPGRGGYPPSHDNLLRLAEIYECGVGDLLTDLPSFRHRDTAAQPTLATSRGTTDMVVGEIIVPSEAELLLRDLLDRQPETGLRTADSIGLLRRPHEVDIGQLAQVIVMWMQRIPHSATRRDMLGKLTAALAVATASPLADQTNVAERANAAALLEIGRFDPATLVHCEAMMPHLRKQGDVLGADSTLPSALAYRRIAEQLAKAAPGGPLRDRAVAAYAELTQLAGWLCFNRGDYRGAQQFYDDARAAAHEARAVELVTYILCTMSHLATWQGKPRVGIDHAVAAASWAEQVGSPYARAYAADVAVRALTADGQADRSRLALDREYVALQAGLADPAPRQGWWYFYDESFFWSTSAQHALKFGGPEQVVAATDKALGLADKGNLHNRSFRMLYRAEAFARQQNLGLACQLITEVVELTAMNSSRRIELRVQQLRNGLDPWKRTRAVKELDQAIHAHRSLTA